MTHGIPWTKRIVGDWESQIKVDATLPASKWGCQFMKCTSIHLNGHCTVQGHLRGDAKIPSTSINYMPWSYWVSPTKQLLNQIKVESDLLLRGLVIAMQTTIKPNPNWSPNHMINPTNVFFWTLTVPTLFTGANEQLSGRHWTAHQGLGRMA